MACATVCAFEILSLTPTHTASLRMTGEETFSSSTPSQIRVKKLATSLVRIISAVFLIVAVGLAGLAIALRQPTFTTIPFHGTTRSRPDALRRHVQFLTTDVRPRSISHPENLERAAAYIEARFRDAGGR